MKVLIIDSNQARNKSLISRLNEKEIMTYSVDTLSIIPSAYKTADVIVLLDQDAVQAKQALETIASDHEQVILTNLKHLDSVAHQAVVYFDYEDNLENSLFNKIVSISEQYISKTLSPIAIDASSRQTLEIARKAAKSQATVLIMGETGVGKEVLAHYIHHHSLVSKGPFVSVNCAALPDNMIEAILFGYERGSFTSAINSYIGKFEQAQNGTLLLDEISEISISLQAKLLRVLQEREVERLGAKKAININVRIIAATNRNLAEQVKAGLFRKDLYYRLNVIPIHCVALRDRSLDIIPLAELFIKQHAKSLGKKIPSLSQQAKNKLVCYSWPGNIREMDNVIQRALIMTESDVIGDKDIQLIDDAHEARHDALSIENNQFISKLEENEAKMIMNVLTEVSGSRNAAAKILNISPRTLRYKLAKLRSIGLKVPNKLSSGENYDH